jgi:sugar phosphate isomerase/epimerase
MLSVADRLGILTDEVSSDFRQSLDWAAEVGLKHVEIRTVDGKNVAAFSDEQARDVRRQVEARGLYVSAVASPLFKCALDPSRPVASGDRFGQPEESVEAHFAKLQRVITIAQLLGTRRIRIFSFWREVNPWQHRPKIVAHLKHAAQIAQQQNVLLLVENEGSCNGGYAEEVGEIVRVVASPSLGALWDPGNEAYAGREAFPRGYSHMKDVLAHVHLKDACLGADGNPRCVPLGSGDVGVIPQLKALADDGYQGLFTLETHFVPEGGNQKTGSRMTLDALRTLSQEV